LRDVTLASGYAPGRVELLGNHTDYNPSLPGDARLVGAREASGMAGRLTVSMTSEG